MLRILPNNDIEFDGRTMMLANQTYSERALAYLAGQAGDTRRVLVGGLGVGATLKELLQITWAKEVVCVEFDDSVLDRFKIDDERVRYVRGNVFSYLARYKPKFDAIIIDVDDTPTNTWRDEHRQFYTEASLRKLPLSDKGRFVLWSCGQLDSRFFAAMTKVFKSVRIESLHGEGQFAFAYVGEGPCR